MSLNPRYATRAEIPADQVGSYVERDGAWVPDMDGYVERARLEEFRVNNVALLKQIEEQRKRYEGIDPDSVRRLAEEKQRLEEQAQLKAGEFEKVLEARLKAVRADFEQKLAGVSGERDALNARLTVVEIDRAVVSEATKRGLRPTALPDITARARNTFRLVNGVPQAVEADGKTVRVGKDGMTPLSLTEWTESLVAEAPHLFEANAGGGATGGGAGGSVAGMVGKNPFAKTSWNLTEQMRITKTDPKLAERLKDAA